jgi:hypothetical protein
VSLLYKPDWDDAKQRFLAWWEGEGFGRAAIAVTAPRESMKTDPPPAQPDDPVRRWSDLQYIVELNDWQHRNTFYGGEAFPVWNGGYPGHTAIPTWLGCPITLDTTTGWWDPFLTGDDWRLEDLRLNKEHPWYKFTIELLQTAAEASRGKSIPGVGAFGGCGDTLAACRGTMRLLHDVMDRPDLVRETELYLMDMWCEVYETFYRIVQPVAEGSTCWFDLWSPGKFYASQCDFSYMISPRMFEDIFIPAIERQLEYLDHSVYHVDGVCAFAHVPALCELPRLQAIQIHPGAGKPSPLHYMDVLKYVQSKRKNLQISLSPHEIEPALAELSSRYLHISTWCHSEAEARELLRNVERWSHD